MGVWQCLICINLETGVVHVPLGAAFWFNPSAGGSWGGGSGWEAKPGSWVERVKTPSNDGSKPSAALVAYEWPLDPAELALDPVELAPPPAANAKIPSH
ncbi:hypothetical protein RJT34_16657 [Clitoria ternatea]|uniref:Uncharacterized protein n=1 Tax=Clitoria ternatea TaxID=43366 RepID=A0AAN9J7U6_CLITE